MSINSQKYIYILLSIYSFHVYIQFNTTINIFVLFVYSIDKNKRESKVKKEEAEKFREKQERERKKCQEIFTRSHNSTLTIVISTSTVPCSSTDIKTSNTTTWVKRKSLNPIETLDDFLKPNLDK